MKLYKFIVGAVAIVLLLTASVSQVAAHAVVKPAEVGIGTFQTFTLGVPSEKGIPTIRVRLVIPNGVNYVTPNVKPGWHIEVKKAAVQSENEEQEKASEIIWTDGNIPGGQRDDFLLSLQAPAEPTTLVWKVYQTYQDGSEIAWELSPSDAQPQKDGKPDFSKVGPASRTQVINDLEAKDANNSAPDTTVSANRSATIALVLSVLAFVFSLSKRPKKAE